MEATFIKEEIERNYSLNIYDIEKVKNSYKIETKEGKYGIKIIKYQFPHFYFIFSAINHLNNKGFRKIPEIIKTKDNEGYIKLGNQYAYLNRWIDSRVCNYKNLDDLARAARKLGELHKCSQGFILNKHMKPRIYWYSWIKTFETRCEEILDFKKRIFQKAYRSEFDEIYLSSISEELERGKKSIDELRQNNYFDVMDKEFFKRGFCHHDFAHHNLLIDKQGEINVIDFDYCILDSHIHDVASLLIRSMKDGNWKKEVSNVVINNYLKTYSISEEELRVIIAFMRFPQGFWQIGLQYYWEQQPWGEEFLVKKLKKYLRDRHNREMFLDNFF